MAYVALYRRYRPRDFDEIVGQEAIVRTLKNQIRTGKIGHAYLFCGMRGTGKTSTARVFAKALNCEQGPTDTPCNRCRNCLAINEGGMIDVIEMDAASNRGIDDIRTLRESVNFPPSEGRYRVYIIDEVHMLTTEAFNALLKTLEEPPEHVVFILATTEPNKLPSTILSRCMRFDFRRVQTRELVSHLKRISAENGVEAEDKALALIARSSQGSMRDALSLLDKALAFGGDKLTYRDALSLFGAVGDDLFFEISRAVKQRAPGRILDIIEEVVGLGKDLLRFTDDLMGFYRNLLMVSIGADRNLVDVTDEEYGELEALAKSYSREEILNILDLLKTASNDVRWASQPRTVLEAAMVKLALPELWTGETAPAARIKALEERVEELEKRLEGFSGSSPAYEAQKPDTGGASAGSQAENPVTGGVPARTEVSREVTPERASARQTKSGEVRRENPGKELLELKEKWPRVLEELAKKGKMTVVNVMEACRVEPVELQKGNLFLSFEGFDGQKALIEIQKNIIEEAIKNITGMEIAVKGFRKAEEAASRDSKDVSDEEFIRSAIELFGEDLVEIDDN
ncbi:DNA polymerase III subunit gamma/tau [Thermosediminibacter oceani]|uniref:DNA-directed DNA polymerase n=1 Tax=Thermosediminibacter oceani (strain ATCC BAA-1034 / DSM 16646 / JW/IW-1228P) TaxID=555079 RepID=D9S0K3_THEOJ|nr:DNA polymerase III subunit gamma/tau [Thermosediminibacter oceani]ADL08861.1 DNA polymerase III, subunits gamma and tau [Thermosediminibacter oceani DSM 16646]